MRIKKINYQNHQFISVKNNAELEIVFSSLGASVYLIKYRDKVITYHPEDYNVFFKSKKYCGKTLGRVCGRIKNAYIRVNKQTYYLDKNEGNNNLHGGNESFSFKDFDYSIVEKESLIKVIFEYTSLDLEGGFPGEVKVVVTYVIMKNKNKFTIHYLATPNKATPINLSTHIYWRLLDKDVLNHRLMVDADEVTKFDRNLSIKGKMHASKILSFKQEKRIGNDILAVAKAFKAMNGYDCGYFLKESDKPQIVLRNMGIKLAVKTDMNMVNIYTNCHASKEKMNSYGMDIIYGGIAIEPQMYRYAIKDIIITAKKPFDHYIDFELGDY